jgi:hypothetical protein
MVLVTTGPEINNDCAGEAQQQSTAILCSEETLHLYDKDKLVCCSGEKISASFENNKKWINEGCGQK